MAPVLYFDYTTPPFSIIVGAVALEKVRHVIVDNGVPLEFEGYVIAEIASLLSIAELHKLCRHRGAAGAAELAALCAALETHIPPSDAAAAWERIAARTEYTHRAFMRRMWPVAAGSNIEWRRAAVGAGIIAGLYPDEIKDGDEIAVIPRRAAPPQTMHGGAQRAADMLRIKIETNFGEWRPSVTPRDPRILLVWQSYFSLAPAMSATFAARMLENPFHCHNITHNMWAAAAKQIAPRPMSYAIYILLKEERMAAGNVPAGSRVIMCGDEFRALPTFAGDPSEGPYLADISAISSGRGGHLAGAGVVGHLAGRRRFTTAAEFAARLSIMCGGALDGIDFAAHGGFVTGSALVPCVAICPLESEFKSFGEFAAHVYRGADIDIGIMAPGRDQYLAAVAAISAAIAKNLGVVAISLSDRRTAKGEKKIADGPEMSREIDFFHVERRPENVISKFHLNCVRFWWDGRELRGTISGVCAALTGVNLWYNWMAANKDPIDVVIKYMRRGYATLLNSGEITTMDRYARLKKITIPDYPGRITGGHIMFSIRDVPDNLIVGWGTGEVISKEGRVIPPPAPRR